MIRLLSLVFTWGKKALSPLPKMWNRLLPSVLSIPGVTGRKKASNGAEAGKGGKLLAFSTSLNIFRTIVFHCWPIRPYALNLIREHLGCPPQTPLCVSWRTRDASSLSIHCMSWPIIERRKTRGRLSENNSRHVVSHNPGPGVWNRRGKTWPL